MTAPANPTSTAGPDAADRHVAIGAPIGSTGSAFVALLARDLRVLVKNLREFIPRTIIQPLLLVFVFTYVFPKIGQGVGGGGSLLDLLPKGVAALIPASISSAVAAKSAAGAAAFSTLLVGGVVGTSIIFQGIQSTALPLVQEFGYTREIEDRVLAPLPVELVAVEKIVAGAVQCLIAGLIVFPIARFVPATAVHLQISWWVLVTIAPLACVCAAALGLTFGTVFNPRTVPLLFGVVVLPITFLGCVYYQWDKLDAIKWLKYVVLVNPLVYICEGFRAALTTSEHMSLWAVYLVLIGFTALFTTLGIRFFKRRVIA